MALWGTGISDDEAKPKWLTAEQKKNVFADDRGWVYVHPNGDEEVIVAIGQLAGTDDSTGLGAPTVSSVAFSSDSITAGENLYLYVYYNEPVIVTGDPSITVTGGTNSVDYSDTDSNTEQGMLAFVMDTTAQSGTVTLAADSSITLNTGTITDETDETTAAELSLNNEELTAEITA